MSATINRIIYILCIAAIIWAFLATKGCSDKAGQISSKDAYEKSLKDTILMTIKAKDGIVTTYKTQVEVDAATIRDITSQNESLNKTLSDMKVKLNNVLSISQIETHTGIKHDTIPVPFPVHDTVRPGRKPVAFSDSTKHYIIKGIAYPTKIILTTIDFPDSTTIVSESQGGLLTKEKYLLKVSHSNPYINTTGIESLVLKPDKKWFQTTAFKIGVGFAAGIYIERYLTR